ncbi:YtxH domain-containing protein [Pontibacter virosus]|uniref:YtxH-like protein n=1 Tax=Pontibacter virosus TaxID=1765052 RepID=A0A2U1B3N3_9BACT|nr:YtxH domain-containing protein [Pontibacter virosus]PVY43202.1 YtxH-like protein [Pontibacter virosus]
MKDNSGKVMLALLAGASAGVIAGLLMAPDTGEQTRTGIKKWANKLSKDLEKNLQTGLDEIKNMSSEAMNKMGGANKNGGNTGGNASSSSTGSTGSSAGGSNVTNV